LETAEEDSNKEK